MGTLKDAERRERELLEDARRSIRIQIIANAIIVAMAVVMALAGS